MKTLTVADLDRIVHNAKRMLANRGLTPTQVQEVEVYGFVPEADQLGAMTDISLDPDDDPEYPHAVSLWLTMNPSH